MHISQFVENNHKTEQFERRGEIKILRFALAFFIALSIGAGLLIWNLSGSMPVAAAAAAEARTATIMSHNVFDYYAGNLDSARNANAVMQSVYCGELDDSACAAKLDQDVHKKGGETLARYLAMQEDIKPDPRALPRSDVLPK